MLEAKFKILCDVCGTEWKAVPDSAWMPSLKVPEGTITVAIVDVCPNCILKPRPTSNRIKFMCDIVRDNETMKKQLEKLK